MALPIFTISSRTSHLLKGQGIALDVALDVVLDVALVVVEKPHLGHFASGRVLQRGLNLSLILVCWVKSACEQGSKSCLQALAGIWKFNPACFEYFCS